MKGVDVPGVRVCTDHDQEQELEDDEVRLSPIHLHSDASNSLCIALALQDHIVAETLAPHRYMAPPYVFMYVSLRTFHLELPSAISGVVFLSMFCP